MTTRKMYKWDYISVSDMDRRNPFYGYYETVALFYRPPTSDGRLGDWRMSSDDYGLFDRDDEECGIRDAREFKRWLASKLIAKGYEVWA